MRIINKTNLSYQEIGKIMDQIINLYGPDTWDEGTIKYTIFEGENYIVKVEIKRLKRYTVWFFTEVE